MHFNKASWCFRYRMTSRLSNLGFFFQGYIKNNIWDVPEPQQPITFRHLSATTQSAENRKKECHRFWLRLHHAVILISNDRTLASKKINGMELIRTLTVSTTAFERTKEKFYGFQQTEQ